MPISNLMKGRTEATLQTEVRFPQGVMTWAAWIESVAIPEGREPWAGGIYAGNGRTNHEYCIGTTVCPKVVYAWYFARWIEAGRPEPATAEAS